MQFTLEIIRSKDYEASLKQSAGECGVYTYVMYVCDVYMYVQHACDISGQTLMNIVENRPKLLGLSELVHPILGKCRNVCMHASIILYFDMVYIVVLMEMIAKEDSAAAGSLFSFTKEDTGILDEVPHTYIQCYSVFIRKRFIYT